MARLWKILTIYDKILIASLILLSVLAILTPVGFFLNGDTISEANKVIVIQQSNNKQKRIAIKDTYREEPLYIEAVGPLGKSIIEAHNGQVRLKEAPPEDPEKICEKTGWIKQTGPIIICVPNQISIWIEMEETNLDGVSW